MSTANFQIEGFKPPKPSAFLTIKKKRTYKKACEYCHEKHFSCSGKRPCKTCKEKGLECKDYTRKPRATPTEEENKSLKKQKPNSPVADVVQIAKKVVSPPPAYESPDKTTTLYQSNPKLVNKLESKAPSLYRGESIYNEEHYSQRESSHSPFVEQPQSVSQSLYDNGSEQVFNNNTTKNDKNRFEYGHMYDKTDEVFEDDSSSSGSSFSSYKSSSLPRTNADVLPVIMSNLPTIPVNNLTNDQISYQKKMLRKQRKKERLEICKYLGPKGFELMFQTDVDLLHQHFPLVPLDDPNEGNFNAENFYYPEDEEDLERNEDVNTTTNEFSNYKIVNFENKIFIPDVLERDKQGNQKKGTSYIMELDQSDKSHIVANPEWTHSLQFTKPSDIYSKITQPFLHTHGFTALLEYIKKRFHKKDVIKICYDIAAIRPVFIASCINFQEEDMIFMEHCFQRTLLEYASFINEVGNPTIVWRRTGQISYVNDEFLMLTGWTRQQLLGKMTFVIEILDDESSLIFFKNFKAVCYSDYTGFVNVPTMRILTPQKGKYIDCSSFFIVKRDTFGLPTFTVGNFLPK